jgi:CopG family nickel-responsive transcriptional regulator
MHVKKTLRLRARLNTSSQKLIPKNHDDLVRFGISMPASLTKQLDRWCERRGYPSRSEAIRDLVRGALVQSQWQGAKEDANAEVERVGVVLLLYEHATPQLSDQLIEMQHHSPAQALASLHIHLTPNTCLEVIVLRGKQTDVVELANHLMSARGVLHSHFIPTTTGEGIF